jgi:asparagine synthase (glutamine-hydrolysing)
VEIALRQQPDRKVRDGVSKWLPRRMAEGLVPAGVSEAPKRPMQTPQREWLRGPLREWANELIECSLAWHGGSWLDAPAVRQTWANYCGGRGDQSFFVWQWIGLGLISRNMTAVSGDGLKPTSPRAA